MSNFTDRHHRIAGLQLGVMAEVVCTTCGPTIVDNYDGLCDACGWESGHDFSGADEQGWTQYIQNYRPNTLRSSGDGDWASGYEVFQLPPDAPDRTVYTKRDMDKIYDKYGLDKDSHQYKPGEGPLGENRKARKGNWNTERTDLTRR
jgi:hypothetical protein